MARNPGLVKEEILSDKIIKGHPLSILFEKADIPLSEQEMAFVDRLTDIVVWAGRYPTPTAKRKWEMCHLPDGSAFLPGTFLGEKDVASAEALWRRVNEVVASDPTAPKYLAVYPIES